MLKKLQKVYLCEEEKLIIKILFSNVKLNKKDFKKINFDIFVKISSSHLILPSLYFNLKSKGNIRFLPDKLKKFLKEIFEINKNRNQVLKGEVKELSEILDSEGIKYIFLKGVANIFGGLYENKGERMIGDIDIFVDKENLKKCMKILSLNNYKNNSISFQELRHEPRLVNKKKMFAVEVHTKLFDRKKNIFLENILSKKNKKSEIFISSDKHRLIINILNFQINDYGNIKLSYSYRSLYDTFCFIERNILPKEENMNSYIKNYLLVMDELKILNLRKSKIKFSKIQTLRFRLKLNYKYYNQIESKVIKSLIILNLRFNQLIYVLKSSDYRSYIIKKLKRRVN